jgi:regulator of protease activity HflC (stomatin/prohibitin superfamily)
MDNLTSGLMIVLGAIGVLVLVSLRRVPAERTYTIDRLGRFHRTVGPGIHVIIPFIDRITHRVSMAGRALDVCCNNLHTNDQHDVLASGMIYFQVLDPRKAANHVRGLDEAAKDLTFNTTREMVEQMSYDSLNHHSRNDLNAWLLGLLNQSASEWGVRVTRINIEFTEQQGEESE